MNCISVLLIVLLERENGTALIFVVLSFDQQYLIRDYSKYSSYNRYIEKILWSMTMIIKNYDCLYATMGYLN